MSKNKGEVINEQKPNGTTVLTGTTREEVAQKFEELKASCDEGATLMAGAVGRNREDGTYTLQVTIVNPSND